VRESKLIQAGAWSQWSCNDILLK